MKDMPKEDLKFESSPIVVYDFLWEMDNNLEKHSEPPQERNFE